MRHQLLVLLAGVCCCFMTAAASAQWNELAKLTAGDPGKTDRFGIAVAFDGGTAIVGSYLDDVGSNADQGSAYVFTGSGETWIQSQKLTASNGVASDRFGNSAAMDGDWAVIGAFYGPSAAQVGSAYMFQNVSGTWTEKQILSPGGTQRFGAQVAIDGTRAVVGTDSSNKAYVYDYNGSTWLQSAILTQPAGLKFGTEVNVKGNRILVSDQYDSTIAVRNGAVYVYDYDGTNWNQSAKLIASDAAASDYFGRSVSLDGDMMAVGAYTADANGTDSGAVYMFRETSPATWTQVAKFIGSDTDAGDNFGLKVLLQGDTLAVGAWLAGIGGQLYTFKEISGVWTEVGTPTTSSDIAAEDNFSVTFDRDGDTLVVAAFSDDDVFSASGSAYVFDYEEVEPPPPPFPGDANNDKVVNEADAAILAQNWLKTGANWGMGDFNDDQKVDDKDATILAVNWLKTAPPVSVPESGCLVLLGSLVSAMLFILRFSRR